jgi:DNA-binding transcriptional regulator WhiA
MGRKYKFNEHYFKEIDTPNKAYFLGLLYADGSIGERKNSCALKLKEEDKYIIETFKEEVEIQKPLYYRKSEPIKGTDYIGKPQYKLELNSKILIEDLKNLGVVPNKSLVLKFPRKMRYMDDFLRGYFDGDGCIYNSQNRIMLNIVGSEDFCKGFSQYLELEFNIKSKPKKENRGKSWYLYIMKIKDVLKFCSIIYYSEACIKLERKYKKYLDYKKQKQLL